MEPEFKRCDAGRQKDYRRHKLEAGNDLPWRSCALSKQNPLGNCILPGERIF